MTFLEWLSDTGENVRESGIRGLQDSLYQLYLGGWRRLGKIYNYGEPIYEHRWDVLIVLDACRADLMAEVADRYGFVDTGVTNSVGSTSAEWLEKNFQRPTYRADVRETAYVTGNPFSDEVFFHHECSECGASRSRIPGEDCKQCGSERTPERVVNHDFRRLEEVWQYGWEENLGTIPPDPITDRAIDVWRSGSMNRMVVHYMQPHHPFVNSDIRTSLSPEGFGEMGRESVWDQLRNREVDLKTVWREYRANLEYVLDDVERLLGNIDAGRVVITADHGNSVGEWGLYGHYRNVPLPGMKRVPWCVTSAENVRKDDPNLATNLEDGSPNVEERLEDLGYL